MAISITGPAIVCQGDNAIYSVPEDPGNVYVWAPGTKGKLLSSGIVGSLSEAAISWKSSGMSTITLNILSKTDGSVIETVTLNVDVLPRPNPVISWDVEVGCQILIPDVEQTEDPADMKIDSTNCIKVCENSIVTYSVPDNAGSTYGWKVSGGVATPSGASCTVEWGSAGAGTVEVTEVSAGGCVGKKFMCIEIVKKPTALFNIMSDPGPGPVSACVFDELVFKDLSDDNGGTKIISWFWDFGDGSTSGDANPTHIYTAAGTYLVKLRVKNECNCSSEYTIEVEVSPETGVKIICPGLVCENSTAKYSIIETCSSYDWSVIGGTILSAFPYNSEIEVRWDAVGDDGIGYVILDAAACSVACPNKTVIKVPVMKTSGVIDGKTIICTNKQYRYKLPRYPATVYSWTLTAGSTGAKIIYTDQTNEIVIEGASPGFITLNCTYTNTLLLSCSGTASLAIELQDPPTITGSTLFCEGETQAYSLSTAVSADWTIQGPEGTITYSGVTYSQAFTVPGTYRLSATGAFCWPDPIDIVVDALPPVPISIAGPSELCANSPGNFSTRTGEANSVFVWEVISGTGDFNGSSGAYTTFTPSGTGPWEISVKSRNKKAPMCESAAITKTITVPNVVSWDISGDEEPCQQSYFNYSCEYTTGYDYKWTLSDPGAGSIVSGESGPNPTILWNATSSPRYCLISVEFKQCGVTYNESLAVYVQIYPTPVVNFDGEYCTGETVDPTIVSGTDFKGGTFTVDDWGDGTSGGTTHVYTDGGTYAIRGRIISPEACDWEFPFTKIVTINAAPSVDVSGSNVAYCLGSPIYLHAIASGTPAFVYSWTSGSSTEYETLTGLALGDHYYTVTVTDSKGCTTNEEVKVTVLDCSGGTPVSICTQNSSTSIVSNYLIADCTGAASTGYTLGSLTDFISHFVSKKDLTHTADGAIIVTSSSTTGFLTFTVDRKIVGPHKFSYTSTYISTDLVNPCTKSNQITVVVPLYVNFDWLITCGTGGKYNATFTSLSSFYTPVAGSGHSYAWTVYRTSGTPATVYTGSGSPSPTWALDPGESYDITLQVTTGTGSYVCSMTRSLTMPDLPVASFTVDFTPVCEGVPVSFNSTSTPGSGLTNYWDFGDGEFNSKNQRTYTHQSGNPDVWPARLTVTDIYGCSDESSATNISVYPNQLEGDVTATPAFVCPDDPISLSFTSTGGLPPNTLVWMHENTPLGVTSYPSGFSVTAPSTGTYWAELSGNYGCKAKASGTYVTVVNVPDPIIVGKPDVCVDEEFVLNAYSGDDVLSYSWEVNDGSGWTPVSTTAPYYDLTESHSSAGVYQYRVSITVEKTSSPFTVCTTMSEVFEVTVHDLPATPVIGYTMLDCNTYELQLTATSADPGIFTWSNGLSGSPVTVYEGGPYKVTLTNAFGCATSSQEFINKDPKEYLWVFPVGCYDLCPSPYFTLNGPAIPFNTWRWYKNSAPVSSGTNSVVTPYNLISSGMYNLYLDNGLCAATSGDLNFNAIGCTDSNCGQNLIVSPGLITFSGVCRPNINLMVTAGTGITVVSYTIAPSMGGYTIISGPGSFGGGAPVPISFTWVPPSTGYPSPSTVEFVFSIKMPSGAVCSKKFTVNLNCLSGPVMYRITDSGYIEPSLNKLSVAPNPAKDMTLISYGFDTDQTQGNKELAVFDMVGRKLAVYPLDKEQGEMELHFGEWSSGIYRLVLMRGAKVVQTLPLSITR